MVIRIWLLATVLFFTTIESYASKSRLEALGQDSNGSFFIKDERNIFLNPANIHKVDRYLSFEWGASGSAEKVDSLGTPKAEGGWYNGKDGMPFAVYLGNENSEAIAFRNHSSNSFLKPDNTFDFIWGMGAGNENRWGMGVTYSKNKDDVTNNIERSEMFAALQAGALIGENWEVFGQFHLVDEADGASADDDEYKGGLGLSIGTIYKGEQYNYYGMIKKKDAEYTPNGGEGLNHNSIELTAGAAQVNQLTNHAFIFYFGELKRLTEDEETGPDTSTKTTLTQIRIGFGVEGRIKSWIALRGSINENVLLNDKSVKASGSSSVDQTLPDTTNVSAGLSLHFNAFKLDGSFATTGGTLNASNIMSRVGMIYSY